jgi:putative sigma-54 modulation protein
MRITVSGRHIGVSDAVRGYCQEKAERLERFYDRIKAIEVILDGQEGQHTAEMIVHSDGTHPFVASEEHKDLYAAVDLLIDKLERQISRHKEKLRNRKHPPRTGE